MENLSIFKRFPYGSSKVEGFMKEFLEQSEDRIPTFLFSGSNILNQPDSNQYTIFVGEYKKYLIRCVSSWSYGLASCLDVKRMLFLIHMVNDDNCFWLECLNSRPDNKWGSDVLEFVECYSVCIDKRNSLGDDLYKIELDLITEIDKKHLWSKFPPIENDYPNTAISESMLYLLTFSYDRVKLFFDNVNSSLLAYDLARRVSRGYILKIATETNSKSIRFFFVSYYLSSCSYYKDYNEELVIKVFSSVSCEIEEWIEWMLVFNHYPCRFSVLQPALGKVLAKASYAAIVEYFKSLSLSSDHSRAEVSKCLGVFSEYASNPVKNKAWEIAYDIWDAWDFEDKRLYSIRFTVLDYALVRYYYYRDEGEDYYAELIDSIDDIKRKWFSEHNARESAIYKKLSRYQAKAHARAIINDNNLNYLQENRVYTIKLDRYEEIFLGIEYEKN